MLSVLLSKVGGASSVSCCVCISSRHFERPSFFKRMQLDRSSPACSSDELSSSTRGHGGQGAPQQAPSSSSSSSSSSAGRDDHTEETSQTRTETDPAVVPPIRNSEDASSLGSSLASSASSSSTSGSTTSPGGGTGSSSSSAGPQVSSMPDSSTSGQSPQDPSVSSSTGGDSASSSSSSNTRYQFTYSVDEMVKAYQRLQEPIAGMTGAKSSPSDASHPEDLHSTHSASAASPPPPPQLLPHPDFGKCDIVGLLRSVQCEAASHVAVWWALASKCGAPIYLPDDVVSVESDGVSAHTPRGKREEDHDLAFPGKRPQLALQQQFAEAMYKELVAEEEGEARLEEEREEGTKDRKVKKKGGEEKLRPEDWLLGSLLAPFLQRVTGFSHKITYHLFDTMVSGRVLASSPLSCVLSSRVGTRSLFQQAESLPG